MISAMEVIRLEARGFSRGRFTIVEKTYLKVAIIACFQPPAEHLHKNI
jgi:hypothetical protein